MTEFGFVRPRRGAGGADDQAAELVDHGVPAPNVLADWNELSSRVLDGDTVNVTSLDRLGESLTQCLNRVKDLKARGAAVTALDGTDLTASDADTLVTLKRVFDAEGSARSRIRRGAVPGRTGRPMKLTTEQVAWAARAVDQDGRSVTSVAAELGVSRPTLHARLKEVRRT